MIFNSKKEIFSNKSKYKYTVAICKFCENLMTNKTNQSISRQVRFLFISEDNSWSKSRNSVGNSHPLINKMWMTPRNILSEYPFRRGKISRKHINTKKIHNTIWSQLLRAVFQLDTINMRIIGSLQHNNTKIKHSWDKISVLTLNLYFDFFKFKITDIHFLISYSLN